MPAITPLLTPLPRSRTHAGQSPPPRPASALAGGCLAAILLLLVACQEGPDARRQADVGHLRLLEAGERSAPAAVEQLERVIGNHGSLAHALAQVAGLPAAAVDPWVHALDGVLDLRRLRPEDRLLVEVTSPGDVARVELVRSKAERYEAVRSASGALIARRIPVRTESRIRRLAGEVETSLYDAMIAAGGDGETVARVADLLAYDVDFLSDPRPGDRFDVLVEETWAEGEAVGGATILLARYEGERARQTAYRFIAPDGCADYYDAAGSSLKKALLRSPLNYRRVSSHFSQRRLHPIRRTYHAHLGVDFAAPVGTPVVAVGEGTVTYAGYKGANGNLVIVKHPNGYETYYLHLQRFAAGVRRGVRVKQGQVIGGVGMTGSATGPHLDVRVKHRGRFLDPEKLALPPGPPVPPGSRLAYAAECGRLLALTDCIAPGTAVSAAALEDYAGDPLQGRAGSTL